MISAINVSKSFGSLCAVNSVTLNVDKDEIFGLVGPDGAGKTTLMRMICGLIEADGGKINLLGQPLRHIEKVRHYLGYMPQHFSLYGDLTVIENINFFASLYGLDKKTIRNRADETLLLTGLFPFKKRFAEQLSGGMKQKLALNCALITRPKLLVLDEPTYGVDPESRREFWKILHRLNQEGITIMVSTPYMDEAELCSKVAFINGGTLKAINSPLGLKKSFPYQVLELRTAEKQGAFLKTMPEILNVSFYGYKYRLIVADTENIHEIIGQKLKERNISYNSLTYTSPTMEDIFTVLAEQEEPHGIRHYNP